jgi:hypothetical protein
MRSKYVRTSGGKKKSFRAEEGEETVSSALKFKLEAHLITTFIQSLSEFYYG